MNRFEFIVKCFCLLMLVLPNSAFADCCCASGTCETQACCEGSRTGGVEGRATNEASQPPCACCAVEVEQISCCIDLAADCRGGGCRGGGCRDCECCECSVPAETVGVLVSQLRPETLDVGPSIVEMLPANGGATFDFILCHADRIPIRHRQRQALLSVWRN